MGIFTSTEEAVEILDQCGMHKDAINAYRATQKVVENNIISIPNLEKANSRCRVAKATSEGRIEELSEEIKAIKKRHNFFTRKLLRIPFPFGKDGKKFRAKIREIKREKKMLKQLKFIEKRTDAKIKANMKTLQRAQKKGKRLGKMLKKSYNANLAGINFIQTLKENESDIRLMYGDQVLQTLQGDAKRIQQKQQDVLDIKQKAKLLNKHLKLFQSGKTDKIDLKDMEKLVNPNSETRATEGENQGTRSEPNVFRDTIDLKYLTDAGINPHHFGKALERFNLDNNTNFSLRDCILFMGIIRTERIKMPGNSSIEDYQAMTKNVYQKIKEGDISEYTPSMDYLMQCGVAAFNAGKGKDANLTIDEFFGHHLAEYYAQEEKAAQDADRFRPENRDVDQNIGQSQDIVA